MMNDMEITISGFLSVSGDIDIDEDGDALSKTEVRLWNKDLDDGSTPCQMTLRIPLEHLSQVKQLKLQKEGWTYAN